MKPVIENLSNDEYHSNRDYLSASTLKQLLANPYEYLNPIERKKDAYVVGSAFHTLTLEPHKFDSEFAVAPMCDKRTKAGKEIYEQFVSSAERKTEVEPIDVEPIDVELETEAEEAFGVAEKPKRPNMSILDNINPDGIDIEDEE